MCLMPVLKTVVTKKMYFGCQTNSKFMIGSNETVSPEIETK